MLRHIIIYYISYDFIYERLPGTARDKERTKSNSQERLVYDAYACDSGSRHFS